MPIDPDDIPSPSEYMDEPEPRCGGSGVLHDVKTPNLDHRDPAFVVDEYECPGCPDCMKLEVSGSPGISIRESTGTWVWRVRPDGTFEVADWVKPVDAHAERFLDFVNVQAGVIQVNARRAALREAMEFLETCGTVGHAAALMIQSRYDIKP